MDGKRDESSGPIDETIIIRIVESPEYRQL